MIWVVVGAAATWFVAFLGMVLLEAVDLLYLGTKTTANIALAFGAVGGFLGYRQAHAENQIRARNVEAIKGVELLRRERQRRKEQEEPVKQRSDSRPDL